MSIIIIISYNQSLNLLNICYQHPRPHYHLKLRINCNSIHILSTKCYIKLWQDDKQHAVSSDRVFNSRCCEGRIKFFLFYLYPWMFFFLVTCFLCKLFAPFYWLSRVKNNTKKQQNQIKLTKQQQQQQN